MNRKVLFVLFSFFVASTTNGLPTVIGQKAIDKPASTSEAKKPEPQNRQLIENAVERLLELQHEDGAWPYEGVYRVGGKIPVGYRIGGTAIVCSALVSADVADPTKTNEAVSRGTKLILKELEHRLMQPSRTERYDVRIWGHIYALDFFCRLKNKKGFDKLKLETGPWIKKLADAVVFQEIESGGWNYANKTRHCCFVTGPAVQSLLFAKQSGIEIPLDVFVRSAEILEASQKKDTIFPYSGTDGRRDTTAGSVARGPVSESTLMLLGHGDQEKLQRTIDSFHLHWEELEKRRKKNGTHLPPHGIAPYYFYYAHRYAAQAIRMLPSDKQESEFKKFNTVLLKTKDSDNTWNDRVFDQSKAYGTAMALLALSRDSVEIPPAIQLAD